MATLLYHANCSDGFCAAWVFWKVWGDKMTYIPVRYGQDPPETSGAVYIVDFSYPPEILDKLKPVRVLDHHKTAEEQLRGRANCTFDMNKSGARLAWEYCFPGRESPWQVDYVEDRDLWRFQLENSKEVNIGLWSMEFDFEVWEGLVFDDVLADGMAIQRYRDKIILDHVKRAKDAWVDGVPVKYVECTVGEIISEVGDALKGDTFAVIRGPSGFSLRGANVDIVAKKYGGGGHSSAAGCPGLEIRYEDT